MSVARSTVEEIAAAVAGLGPGDADRRRRARAPGTPFSEVLKRHGVYLANHSLGRPLDATVRDVAEAITLWQRSLGNAWTGWLDEMAAYRSRFAQLMGAPSPDCVVPKTSAGQGLRAVLNSYDAVPRVLATRDEFDSIDVILREYARRGRIRLTLVEPAGDGAYTAEDLRDGIRAGADLVVLSQVLFNSGQVLPELDALVAESRVRGARVLLDVYHSLGVLPVDVAALDVDFAVGGSYKYLRGGPGAGFLYLHPRHLDGSLSTLDIGWYAKKGRFGYQRPEPPQFAPGGDAWLESTPAILPFYQARAGQVVFTLAVGVERLRAYSVARLRALADALRRSGVPSEGGDAGHGAFLVVRSADARRIAATLETRGVTVDARGDALRICPDVLTTAAEIESAAALVAELLAERSPARARA